MATYKVLQDIEAEDKLVGPLTLRQFVYAGIAALFLYLTFLVVDKGAPLMAVVLFPVGLVSAFFAWPWSRDQPTEVWALARFRFLLKPRKRIWDQDGMRELVTITAPKKIERALTNGLSQTEVHSRLRALSDTLDSRGWAVKNVNVSMYGMQSGASATSDRLVSSSSLPQPVESIDIKPADDMLDVRNNPVAAQFDTMIAASAKAHRQEIIDKMKEVKPSAPPPAIPGAPAALPIAPPAAPAPLQASKPANDYWFLNQPTQATPVVQQDNVTFNTQVVAPGSSISDLPVASATPTADEESFIKHLKAEPAFSPNMHGHLHVIQPLSAQNTANPPVANGPVPLAPPSLPQQVPLPPPPAPTPPVTQGPDPVTLDLVRNDDLDVATIAREAGRRKEPPKDEVVISLH